MKIAIAGKGGTGKTTTTTLLTTYLAQSAYVLSLDADSNENLAQALGFDRNALQRMKKIRHFTDAILSYTKTDQNWETRHVTPHPDAGYFSFKNGTVDPIVKETLLKKDRITVAHLGTVDADKRGIQSMCGAYSLMRIFLNHLKEEKDDVVLVDLPAGNELLTRAAVINMDHILLVVEPTTKNLSVAKDILLSVKKLLFDRVYVLVNKSFSELDIAYVSKELHIPTDRIQRIPFSQEIIAIDNRGELSFATAPQYIKTPIQDIALMMQKDPIETNVLEKRAKAIDARLFPHAESQLTEEIHI